MVVHCWYVDAQLCISRAVGAKEMVQKKVKRYCEFMGNEVGTLDFGVWES